MRNEQAPPEAIWTALRRGQRADRALLAGAQAVQRPGKPGAPGAGRATASHAVERHAAQRPTDRHHIGRGLQRLTMRARRLVRHIPMPDVGKQAVLPILAKLQLRTHVIVEAVTQAELIDKDCGS